MQRAGNRCLFRQRECLGFDFHKDAAEGSDARIKFRRLGVLEIRKETPDPRLEMSLEDIALGLPGSNDLAAGEAGHDFAKHRSVILGLGLSFSPLEAKLLQGFTDPGEGAPVEVTRQIL
jgi:hypothetical protein